MTDAVLALNTGSSSVKFSVARAFAPGAPLLWGAAERLGTDRAMITLHSHDDSRQEQSVPGATHANALQRLLAILQTDRPDLRIAGVGHRIVHGGHRFTAPEPVTPEVLAALEDIVPLAPLHQPHGIGAIRAAQDLFPDARHVACFDTAFHAGKPFEHDAYGLPRRYYDEGVRRYGFHGLACQSICTALRAEGFPLDTTRLAIAHLGNGCSVTAVENGRSKATSMGFSVLDGLTMGTRCGALDPGVILHLLRTGHSAEEVETLLYHRSGLLGLSGLSSDMRDLTASDRPEAAEAVSHFVARVVGEVCRAAGAMGGLDVLVFSGGIGENAAPIRTGIMQGLAFLPGRDGSGVETMVRAAREEDVLLRAAAQVSKGR
ncbi:acetate/propionate family kinase [Sagittula sp.]|uniref:acetate/propionate family kinase n=1 Tax=Sagittula sp. TaxID=2038081 RepID=UPI0035127008